MPFSSSTQHMLKTHAKKEMVREKKQLKKNNFVFVSIMYNSNQDRQKQEHKKRTYFASRTSPTDLRLLSSTFFIPGPTSV